MPESAPTPVAFVTSPSLPHQLSWTRPIHAQGYIETVYTLTSLPTAEIAWTSPSTDSGAMRIMFFPSSGEMDAVLNLGVAGQVQGGRMDIRKVGVLSRKIHRVDTWGPTSDGGLELQSGQQGSFDQPTVLGPSNTHVADLTSAWVGKTVAGASLSSVMTVHRFAVGDVRVTAGQLRLMAADAGVSPTYRVACLGDSITAFQDGFHARLQSLLGAGAVVSNWGNSGDTVSQALVRLAQLRVVPYDLIIVLLGVNDIGRVGMTALATEKSLKELYGWAISTGVNVLAVTPLPFKDNAAGWWTSGKQTEYDALRAWIATQAGGLVSVFDGYAIFNSSDTFSGYPTLNNYTYDGTHPRGLYTVNRGGAVNGSDTLADAVYAALGSPSYP